MSKWLTDKVEVYFSTCPQSDERKEVAAKMLRLWESCHWAKVEVLTPERLGCSPWRFQKTRRIAAETMALNHTYLLVDDDIEPTTDITIGLYAMHTHQDFALLSAWIENANIGLWTPEDYKPYRDSEVLEHCDAGGLRIIRRGCIGAWPEQTRRGYDREHCEALRANLFRVGYCRHFKAFHHGEGHSDLWEKGGDEMSRQILGESPITA